MHKKSWRWAKGKADKHTEFAKLDNPRGLLAIGDKLYVLYTIWNQDDVFVIYTHEGFEDLEVPYGAISGAMKVKVEIFHVSDDIELVFFGLADISKPARPRLSCFKRLD